MKRILIYVLAFLASKGASASLNSVNDEMDVNQHPNKFGYTQATNRDLLIQALVEKNGYDLNAAQIYVEQRSEQEVIELLKSLGTDGVEQYTEGPPISGTKI